MKHIRCRACLFDFMGDIVCMACATGYELDFGVEGPALGKTAQLIQVFRFEPRCGIDGKTRNAIITDRITTHAYLTISGSGEFIEIDGVQSEFLQFPTAGIPCPRCSEQHLKFTFDNPDRCPHCGKRQLYSGGLLF